jgi:hypothetical protein
MGYGLTAIDSFSMKAVNLCCVEMKSRAYVVNVIYDQKCIRSFSKTVSDMHQTWAESSGLTGQNLTGSEAKHRKL